MYEIAKPIFSKRDAEALVHDIYGLEVASITQLVGWDDLNFRVETCCDDEDSSNSTKELILKIVNSYESQEPNRYEGICQTLDALQRNEYKVPQPMPAKSGSFACLRDLGGRSPNAVMLLTYLPGTTLDHVKPMEEEFLNLAESTGAMVAKMNKFMIELPYVQWETASSKWMLENVTSNHLSERLDTIDDVRVQETCVAAVTLFEREVRPLFKQLRRGLIHGDVNPGNIIVTDLRSPKTVLWNSSHQQCGYKINGLIDFGELKETKIIFEVATMVAYFLCQSEVHGYGLKTTLLSVLKGYESKLELTEIEKGCLYMSVLARLVCHICCLAVLETDLLRKDVNTQDFARSQTVVSVLLKLWNARQFHDL